jgi:hypothetical protein
MDTLQSILDSAQADQTVKADAWDAFKNSTDTTDLTTKIKSLALPDETKAKLWDLKKSMTLVQQKQSESTGETWQRQMGNIGKYAANVVSQGGPAAVGAIGGGMLGGPPGAVIGAMLAEGGKQVFNRLFAPELAPATGLQGAIDMTMAGAGGALTPEALAVKFPLAANAGKYGAELPATMKYARARELVATAPERRLAMELETKQLKAVSRQTARNEQAVAQRMFNDRVERNIRPVQEEKTVLLNQKTQQSASLAEQKPNISNQGIADRAALRTGYKNTKGQIIDTSSSEADSFVKSVGTEMKRAELIHGTAASRKMGYDAITQKVSDIYNDIRNGVFANNIRRVVNHLPDGSTQEISIEGPIDLAKMKAELKPFADANRDALTIAKQNGSPGATAILETVDGPNVIPGSTAIENLAALNKAGYHKADAVIRERGEFYVRKLADKYREALRESLTKMDGGGVAIQKLNEAKSLLKARDSQYRIGEGIEVNKPIAQRTWERFVTKGDLSGMSNDPVKLRLLYNQVDTPTLAGLKSEWAKGAFGKNVKDFSKNWKYIDDEVKALNLTPQQIAQGNLIATKGELALKQLSADVISKNQKIIDQTNAQLRAINQERRLLADTTVKVRALSNRVQNEKDLIKRTKLESELYLNTKAAQARMADEEVVTLRKQNFEIQLRQARKRIEDVKQTRKYLLVAGGIGLAGAANFKWQNAIKSILGINLGTP